MVLCCHVVWQEAWQQLLLPLVIRTLDSDCPHDAATAPRAQLLRARLYERLLQHRVGNKVIAFAAYSMQYMMSARGDKIGTK